MAMIVAYALIIMTIVGFVLTVTDRIMAKATDGAKRIKENFLLAIAFLLGGVGVMVGFFLAKHGLYKPETRLGVPAVAVGETILLFWFIPGVWDAIKIIFS